MLRMRVPEYYWWLETLIGLAAAVGAIVAPVNYLGGQLPLDQALGYSFNNDLLLAAALGGMFLILSLVLVVKSVRSRDRYRHRKSALAGNLHALPLSRLAAKPEDAPDVSKQPLVLSWKVGGEIRFFMGPCVLIMVLMLVVAVLALCVPVMVGAIHPQWVTHAWVGVLSQLAAALVFVATIVASAIFFTRYAPTIFGRPYGVTANDEGMDCQPTFGQRFTVSWSEMRLFEILSSESAGDGLRLFRIFGMRRIVEWNDSPSGYYENGLDGMTSGEMAWRLQAMINLVTARTGLAPRTLSKSLQAHPSQP